MILCLSKPVCKLKFERRKFLLWDSKNNYLQNLKEALVIVRAAKKCLNAEEFIENWIDFMTILTKDIIFPSLITRAW